MTAESNKPSDDDLSPEWKAEIERRIEAVERGESRLLSGHEVAAIILAMLDPRPRSPSK